LLKGADFFSPADFLGNDCFGNGLAAWGSSRLPLIGPILNIASMPIPLTVQIKDQLDRLVRTRTGRRIRNLAIELDPERVVLRGQASSFYVKQMAQQGIRDFLPNLVLENSIEVEKGLETATLQD
jgi:hypothetical protein